MIFVRLRCLLCLLYLFTCGSSLAQSPLLRHERFNQNGIDSIDLTNLSVQLSFPIINKPGRGVPTSFALTYDGNFWSRGPGLWEHTSYFGWNWNVLSVPGSFSQRETEIACNHPNQTTPALYKTTFGPRTWTDSDGVSHRFTSTSQYNECTDQTTPFPSWDFSQDGYSIDANSNVYNSHGEIVNQYPPSDVNGNSLSFGPTASCSAMFGSTGCLTDTTGTPALGIDETDNAAVEPTLLRYYYLDNNGTKQTITVAWSTFTVQTNFGAPATTEFAAHQYTLPVSITYPHGTYTLTYEPTPGYPGSTTGRIASVTLPTGSVISYTYSGPNTTYADWYGETGSPSGAPSSGIQRTTSDGTIGFTQSYPDETVAQTSVQYPSGRTETYSFAGGQYPALIGHSALGQTTSICYSGMDDYVDPYTCSTHDLTLPILTKQITTTLDNGLQNITTETYNRNTLLTEKDEGDFGTNSSPLRKTLISYSTAFTNLFDRVQQVLVEDANGNRISETDYQYDQVAATPTSGLPNHAAPTLPPGNLTQVSFYNSGGNALVTNYTVDDAGQLRASAGPGPGQTVYSYDSTDSYLTQTTLPQVGSTTLNVQATYNAYSGEVTSRTDANSHKTLYSYDTSLRLLTETNDIPSGGDGAVTTHVYSGNDLQVSTTRTIGNGSTTDSESFTDGYGRAQRSARANGSGSWLVSDTCYDGDGRISFRSLPYVATNLSSGSMCSGSGDSYSYDSYGRLKTTTHADSSQVSYFYAGRAVKITDEGASGSSSTRVIQSDGLGRVATVCEYSSGSGMIGTPAAGSCGTDINVSGVDASATGYVTQYTYDLANRKTTAIQAGSTNVRQWQYDSIGRLIADQVPERKLPTTFAYTMNAAGLQISRVTAAPNQPWTTSSPTTMTTNIQMDALGRPAGVIYNDGITPSIAYSYDVGTTSPQSHNMLGRLAAAAVGSRVVQFSYTSNGQSEWQRSCLASTCAGGNPTFVQQSLGYNQLQAPTSIADGAGNTIGYAYDAYGRLGGVSESLNAAGFPASLLGSFNYGAFGLSSVAYGNGVTGSFGYDSRGRNNSFHGTNANGNVYGYDLVWGANGSLTHSSDTVSGAWTYTYDEFNRLKTAVADSNVQGYSYQYDVWGNRWNQTLIAGTGYTVNNTFESAQTNHIASWTYDVNGNVLWNGSHSYTYDPEGHVLSVDGTTQYVYGPEGGRWQVTTPSGTRNYVYSPFGQLSSVWNGTSLVKANIYSLGQKFASYSSSGVSFEYGDWLGSSRVITDSTGATTATYNSAPFGLPNQSTLSDQAQTAGLDWDAEAEAGHAWARTYNTMNGVWLSPDPSNDSYDLGKPQSLNRYAYVGNDPMSYNDTLGLARYNDSPDPDGPFGGSESAYYGGGQDSTTISDAQGCGVGAGDLCRAVIVAWDWLSSHLGSGGSPSDSCMYCSSNDGTNGLASREASLFFQTRSNYQVLAQQSTTTTQGQNAHFVSVSYWATGAGGFGHIGIGVDTNNTQGYSTADPHVPWYERIFGAPKGGTEFDIPAHTKNGETAPHSYMHIAISADQAAAMHAAMDARTANGGHYNLIFNNCAQFVESVLHAGGVSGIPHGEVFGPAILGAAIWYGNTWR